MNLLLITDGITPFVTGGMQRHSANLAKYFTRAGVNITLIHCVGFDQELPSDKMVNQQLFGDMDTQLHKIIGLKFPKPGKIPGHYLRESYQYSKIVFNAIDFNQFDFIYTKGFTGWYAMEQKKKGIKLPPISVKFHGYEMFQNMPSLKQKIESKLLQGPTRWNNENADYIFSYGGKITNLILKEFKVTQEHVFDFTSGLNKEWLRPANELKPKHKRKFVFMGRDEERKGINDLNEVLKKLPDHFNYEFHFIGPIPESKQMIDAKFIYHGELRSAATICAVLDEMDILVCPSHAEGMPNVILEGMARGLAIIATDTGAVEMLVDNSNGYLVPTHNKKALEKALTSSITLNDASLLQLKLSSLEKIETEFLWDKLILKMITQINAI